MYAMQILEMHSGILYIRNVFFIYYSLLIQMNKTSFSCFSAFLHVDL